MARENSECSAGNGTFVGRRACHYRFRRDSMALQYSWLRPAAYTRLKSLCDRHSRIPAPLYTTSQDPTIRQRTPQEWFLLPRGLRQVSEQHFLEKYRKSRILIGISFVSEGVKEFLWNYWDWGNNLTNFPLNNFVLI